MPELARAVRPGGVIAVASEYLLLAEQNQTEYFNQQDLEDQVINATRDRELLQTIDRPLPLADFPIDSIMFPQGIDRIRSYVVLNDGWVQRTSVLLFLRKRLGSFAQESNHGASGVEAPSIRPKVELADVCTTP